MPNAKEDPEVMRFFESDMLQVCEAEAPADEWTIGALCRVIGDRNPVYQDEAAAIRYGHSAVFAPPIMMHCYTLPGLIDETQDNMQLAMRRRLAELGMTSGVAVNCEQDYVTPIRLGDRLTRHVRLARMSDPKPTALGIGHFIDTDEAIYNQSGELIGRQMIRALYFRPVDRSAASTPGADAGRPLAAKVPLKGVELPSLEIPMTTTMIVAGALATNDFEKVHHDRDAAQAQGMKDIFMNFLTSSALATRLVTDWAGPAARLKRTRTRLNAPNYPGDTMTVIGHAETPYQPGKETVVHVRGINAIGIHIDISITIS